MGLILNFFGNIYHNKKYLIVGIFLASVFCSLIFLIFFKNIGPVEHRHPGTDYLTWYKPIADNILKGEGITVKGNYIFYIAPGFPVILSGVFAISQLTGIDELDLVVVLNIILTAVSSCFLFFIAKEIFNKKIALIASFLWMSYPFNLWFIKNPNTEAPFISLLFAGVLFYILTLKRKKLRFAFLGGVILGLSSLIRCIGLFLPFLLALFIFFFLKAKIKRKLCFTLIFLIGALLPFLFWEACIFSETGGFFPISAIGTGNFVQGITALSALVENESEQAVPSNDLMSLIERTKTEDLSSEVKIIRFFSREIINRPIPVLKLIGLKLARSWYATSEQWWEGKILAVQLLYLITGFFGLLYGIKAAKNKIQGIILFLAIIFYFWGMTFLAVSILRYMIPAMGLVIIFSAVAINVLIDKFAKKFRFCSL